MFMVSKSSNATKMALVYVTAGALTLVWTAVWAVYLWNNPPSGSAAYYFCAGLGASGLMVLVIGLGLGRLGRAAQSAEASQVVSTPADGAITPTAVPVAGNGAAKVPPPAPTLSEVGAADGASSIGAANSRTLGPS